MSCSDELANVASELLGRQVADVFAYRDRGGNSGIFRILDVQGRNYALKFYPDPRFDPRDRLGTEVEAIRLLGRCNGIRVPDVVAYDKARRVAIYEWLPGVRPEPTEMAVDGMLVFMETLRDFRNGLPVASVPMASEHCLTGAEILRQVKFRLARLQKLAEERELQEFLRADVEPLLGRLDLTGHVIPDHLRCLNPGDFGTHNMIEENGSFAFIDMEYFGWDDPVKQVCDVLWHPAMTLPGSLAQRFAEGAKQIYGRDDPLYESRLVRHMPAFGLRWIMIVLNEFLPERWAIRSHAGAMDWIAAKHVQIGKARGMVAALRAYV